MDGEKPSTSGGFHGNQGNLNDKATQVETHQPGCSNGMCRGCENHEEPVAVECERILEEVILQLREIIIELRHVMGYVEDVEEEDFVNHRSGSREDLFENPFQFINGEVADEEDIEEQGVDEEPDVDPVVNIDNVD